MASSGFTQGLKSELGVVSDTYEGATVSRDGINYDKFGMIGQAQQRIKDREKRAQEIKDGKGLPAGFRRKHFRYDDNSYGQLSMSKGGNFSFFVLKERTVYRPTPSPSSARWASASCGTSYPTSLAA